MAEKLEITVSARDQASPAIKAVGAAVTREMAQVKGAAGGLSAATSQMAIQSVGGFAKMKAAATTYRTEIALGATAVAGFAAGATLAFKGAIDAALEQAHATDRLNAAIAATGQAIDSAKLIALAEQLQRTTRFTDEETEAMMASLMVLGFSEAQIIALTPRIQNLAAVMDKDLGTAARLVGVSIQKNIPTMTRFGVVIDKDAWSAANFEQKLGMLDARSKGVAEAMGKGADSALILKHQLDEVKESVGAALLPAVQAALPIITSLARGFQVVAESPIGKVLIIAAAGATALAGALAAPIAAVLGLSVAYTRLTAAAGAATVATGAATAAATGGLVAGAAAAGGAAAGGAAAAAPAGGAAVPLAAAGGAAAGRAGLAARELGAVGRAAPALARIGRGALGVAGRVALPAWLAYEGAKLNIGEYQRQLDEIEKALSSTEYTPKQKAFMKRWAEQRKKEVKRQQMEAQGEAARPAAGGEWQGEESAALAEAAAQELAAMPWPERQKAYRKKGLGGIATNITNRTRNVDVSARDTAEGEELLIRVQTTKPEDPDTDQAVTNYLDDLQYAEAE